MPELTDEQLIKRAVKGDDLAFEQIVERYEASVYNFAFSYLKDKSDAEDATQEVFMKLWRSLGQYRGDSSVRTYVFRIMRNTCIDFCRSRDKIEVLSTDAENEDGEKLLSEIPDHDVASSPQASYIQNETVRAVRDAISDLPENYREIIILKDMEDRSYHEIGEILGLEEGTVKSRLSRARQLLKNLLEKRNIF